MAPTCDRHGVEMVLWYDPRRGHRVRSCPTCARAAYNRQGDAPNAAGGVR